MSDELSEYQQVMLKQFQVHVEAELRQDVEATMATMSDNPHIYNVPTLAGATGINAVRDLYTRLLPGNFFPPDTEIIPVSRTIDNNQIVDENIMKFTHTITMGWMLPGIAPTGRRVEIPMVIIFKFTDGKVAHEHVYWDQASVLVQLGLLNPKDLPIHGIESAKRLAELASISA